MRSVPVPGVTQRGEMLGFIPGAVPRALGALVHCGFLDRCPYAHDRCTSPIPLAPAFDGRLVRCVLPTDGSGRDGGAWTRLVEGA
jgi:peptide/nickel transport system ATP-binding protein